MADEGRLNIESVLLKFLKDQNKELDKQKISYGEINRDIQKAMADIKQAKMQFGEGTAEFEEDRKRILDSIIAENELMANNTEMVSKKIDAIKKMNDFINLKYY